MNLYGVLVGVAIAVVVEGSRVVLGRTTWNGALDHYIVAMIISGMIGARVYHVITDWPLYAGGSLWQMFAIWHGGVGLIGGVIGALIGALSIAVWTHQQNHLMTLFDSVAIYLPLGQAIGRWGNYVNQEIFGRVTHLPWGIRIDRISADVRFHPLFVYESLLNVCLHLILLHLFTTARWSMGRGKYVGAYLLGYGIIRFLLEFLRVETARSPVDLWSTFSIAQWWMMGWILFGGALLWRKTT